MKRLSPCAWTLLWALAALAVAVAAHGDPTHDARAELERTAGLMAEAKAQVSISNNLAAQVELNQAARLQSRAEAMLANGNQDTALDFTFRARSRAMRAIAMVRGLPDPERVLAQLERTQEVLVRSNARVERCDDSRARALLGMGIELQRRSAQAARAERYLAALQLTMSAREHALGAMRRCHLGEDPREGAGRALSRTDEVIARAKAQISEPAREQARQALSRAIELQDQARAEFQAEHVSVTYRLTQSARALAFRAIRLAGGNP